jgi:hypothetical protein
MKHEVLVKWAMLSLISASGCGQRAHTPEELAAHYQTHMQAEELEAAVEGLRSLSADEVDAFNEARERLDLEALRANRGGQEPGDVAQRERDLRAVTAYRKQLNRKSMALYQKPYTQIDGDQFDRLLSLTREDGIATKIDKASCDEGQYRLTAEASGPTWRTGTGWATYYENRVNGQTDCDLVYAFRGTFNRILAITPADATLMAVLGGRTAMRQTGYSDIVVGTNKVWVIYGHPSLVSLRMY